MRYLLPLLVLSLAVTSAFAQKRAMTFEDMFTMKRISNIAVSPDGEHVLFRVRQADIESNGYEAQVHLLTVATGDIKAVTPLGGGSPQWRPDGKAFVYTKGGQVWLKTLDGGEPVQVTAAPMGAGGPRFSNDGEWLLFASQVSVGDPDKDHSGRLIDELFFRQWNSWIHDVRNHVFIVSADAVKHPGRDLTPGMVDSPPVSLGSSHDYTFSPDGKSAVVVMNTDPVVATSTNNDLFHIDLASGERKRITDHRGGDAEPYFSPDGRYIAYFSMEREGFEADQHRIHLYDTQTGKSRELTHQGDRDAAQFAWRPDSRSLVYSSRVEGARSLYLIGVDGGEERLTTGSFDHSPQFDKDGKRLFFLRETTTMPAELFVMDWETRKVRQLTQLNQETLDQLAMNPWEDFWYESTNGVKVQGFIIKPPFFEEGKKYPLIYLIHGGPQGMWSNNFHYRWNSQMFAAPGNVVVLVNPHGSKGYGQEFCDAVTKDWGGQPYEDLMKGVEVALERYPFIDRERMGAAGASYGGYMVNWIAVQDHPFDALVSHNGVFNMPSMAGTTEELWFPEWEFGGTYYDNPELYEKWSPHRKAKGLSAPMLVIHSELDYRVPINQGIELFTAHRRQGVTARWLYFPDEDHFVTKPHNARMWWRTVHGWYAEHLK